MITGILKIFSKVMPVIDKVIVDKDKARELKFEIEKAIIEMDRAELSAATSIISAELGGESWLQKNWRPITMLSFLGLLYSYWLGIAPPQIYDNPELMHDLFNLLQVGIGGYIGSRGIEKVVKTWKEPEKVEADAEKIRASQKGADALNALERRRLR